MQSLDSLHPWMLTLLGVGAGVLVVIVLVAVAIRVHAARARLGGRGGAGAAAGGRGARCTESATNKVRTPPLRRGGQILDGRNLHRQKLGSIERQLINALNCCPVREALFEVGIQRILSGHSVVKFETS